MDKYGVLWTRYSGSPVKLAEMTLTPSELRVTKTKEAINLGLPGISLVHDKLNHPTMVFPRTPTSNLPPQLRVLMPPRNNNPQYVILSKLLERRINIRGMPIIDQEWEMLLFAGRNGIGHVDAFKSDQDAERYYLIPSRKDLSKEGSSALWAAFKRIAEGTASNDDEIEEIIEAIGPTPGVTGFNPKLLTGITLNANGDWDGVTSPDNGTLVLAKIDTPHYPGLIPLEHLCYQYHKLAGLDIPRIWRHEFEFKSEKVSVMATERFDRHHGLPIPLESLYSILQSGSPGKFFDTTDGSMEDVWKALKLVSENSTLDRADLFTRLVMSFLTGNGDLHLENWAILGANGNARLSPVFDPAPMRAYRGMRANHDILSAISFSGIGGMGDLGDLPFAQAGKTPDNLFEKICEFGVHMGMSAKHCRDRVAELVNITKDYPDHAASTIKASVNQYYKPKSPDIDGFITTLGQMRDACRK